MDLREFLGTLLRHWLTIVLCIVVAMVASIGVTLLMTPQYKSSSVLYVMARTPGAQGTSDVLQGSNYARQAVLSYVQVIGDAIVLDPVIARLGLDMTAAELSSHVTATSPTNTVIINITATDDSPTLAADIANAVAQSLATVIMDELEKTSADTTELVKVTQTQQATVPTSPASPNLVLNLAIGLVAGLALGIGLAWLRSVLDTRINSADDLKNVTGGPLLGTIPFDPESQTRPLVVHDEPHSPVAEEYRGLRTNLVFTNVGGKGQCVVISSANPSDGKSTTAANLAITLADSARRVVLIDCDFRRPALARYMRVEGGVGLSDILVGRAQPVDVLQRWGNENLYVLPTGHTPPNPSELLGSDLMQDLVAFLLKSFDYVLIDSPPLLVATDATVLSRVADGVVLVASYDTTRRHALAAAVNSLNMVGGRLLGTILTKVPAKKVGPYRSGHGYGAGYGYGYGYYGKDTPGTQSSERSDS